MVDHEMNIEGQRCQLANSCHCFWPKGDVIDKMTVHDVAMNPIGSGVFYPVDFIGQSGKICGQNGGGDEHRVHRVASVWNSLAVTILPTLQHSTNPFVCPDENLGTR